MFVQGVAEGSSHGLVRGLDGIAPAAARSGVMRGVVLELMTGCNCRRWVLVVASDDAQAGLAVLLVSYVAIPLAAHP